MKQGVEGEDPLVVAALQNFVGLSYVDDNHGLGHNGSSVVGIGSDGCHAFSTNSQVEASVGAISVHLKVEQKWQDVFGAAVIGGYTVDNFGWCGSPATNSWQSASFHVATHSRGNHSCWLIVSGVFRPICL